MSRAERTMILHLLVALVALFPAHARAGTVAVEFGARGETVFRVIRAENLARGVDLLGALPPGKVPVAPVPATRAAPSPSGAALAERFPHLFAASPKPAAEGARRRTLDRLVGTAVPQAAPPPPARVAGEGRAETLAVADGKATIRPTLRTYRPATMRVRLLDAAGAEQLFGGESLFVWSRADDRAFSPLKFKGQPDDRSMKLVKAGDFSPAEGLVYEFEVKRGQKIVVEQTGSPERESVLEVTPPAAR